MALADLIRKNRSYRRFRQDRPLERGVLRDLVELARCSASAANLQPLKYVLSCTPETNDLIFPHLAWAGYLKDWQGPEEGERPSAYIVIVGDTEVAKHFGCDYGIAAQSILLGAAEKGLGGCMIGAIQKDGLREAIHLQDRYEILLVLALGEPKEDVVIERVVEGNIKYWRDEQDVHHVPKRSLEELILELPQ